MRLLTKKKNQGDSYRKSYILVLLQTQYTADVGLNNSRFICLSFCRFARYCKFLIFNLEIINILVACSISFIDTK